jgi:hypothetical protein
MPLTLAPYVGHAQHERSAEVLQPVDLAGLHMGTIITAVAVLEIHRETLTAATRMPST